jgi:hypothetical protein
MIVKRQENCYEFNVGQKAMTQTLKQDFFNLQWLFVWH